jgi:hypothetical protein
MWTMGSLVTAPTQVVQYKHPALPYCFPSKKGWVSHEDKQDGNSPNPRVQELPLDARSELGCESGTILKTSLSKGMSGRLEGEKCLTTPSDGGMDLVYTFPLFPLGFLIASPCSSSSSSFPEKIARWWYCYPSLFLVFLERKLGKW